MNHSPDPQDLGVLTPTDLQAGVTVTGRFQSENADTYELQIPADWWYGITLNGVPVEQLSSGSWVSVTDMGTSQPVTLLNLNPDANLASPPGSVVSLVDNAALHAGTTYALQIDSWGAAPRTPAAYFLSQKRA